MKHQLICLMLCFSAFGSAHAQMGSDPSANAMDMEREGLLVEAYIIDPTLGRQEVNAEIFLDGWTTGRSTPAVLHDVVDGPHEIRVQMDCSEARATVESQEHLELELEVLPSFLEIQVVPSNARLQLDGRVLEQDETMSYPVSCGSHTLSASLEGYTTMLDSLDVGPGQIESTVIYLQPLGVGTVDLSVEPSDARVTIDGENIRNRETDFEIYEGPHVISVGRRGFVPIEETFFVIADEVVRLNFTLQPEMNTQISTVQNAATLPVPWTRVAAYGLTTAGAVVSILGGVQFLQTSSAYAEYRTRVETVNEGRREPSYATGFYDAEVAPKATRMRLSLGVGATALAGGLVLAFRY